MSSLNLFVYEEPHREAVNFPIVNSSVWVMLILLSVFILFGFKIGPHFMKNRKPYDVRPFILILNGTHFGVYVFGSVLIWWLLRTPNFGWTYYDGFSNTLIQFFTLRVGYLYMIIDLMKIFYVVLWILKKKETRKVQMYTLDSALHIFMSFYTMRYHPAGPFALRIYITAISYSFKMIYYILVTAGKTFTPPLWYKVSLIVLDIYTQFIIVKCFFLEPLLKIPLIINLIILIGALSHAGYGFLSLKNVMISKKYL